MYSYSLISVAYPELVSRGVSKSRKCKWLVKVGASNGVTPTDKKIMAGGFPDNQNHPGYATGNCDLTLQYMCKTQLSIFS